MNIAEEIRNKRNETGLSVKEFADAICLGKNGDKMFRSWENGETTPSEELFERIMNFASVIPFKDRKKRHSFRFIDLFAGIGGIRLPFQELGGKCVFTSEWDAFAQKTYKFNFGEQPYGDITKISSEDIPDFDILLGGFPCQPFSQAGLHKGFSDTRGTLFFEIERIIKDKQPDAFLLENVKQLKGHNKGRTFAVISEHLKNLNYTVSYAILRAGDFGVPQNRERIYIVGFRKDKFRLDNSYDFPFPKPPKTPTRLGDILETDVDERYTISERLYEGHKRRKEEHKLKGNGFGFSMYTADSEYTNTLSARYYKDGSEILIYQGEDIPPRKLTPRECARLQGFPEEFVIPVSNPNAYKQFGNSVAVPVIRAIAEQMLKERKRLLALIEG